MSGAAGMTRAETRTTRLQSRDHSSNDCPDLRLAWLVQGRARHLRIRATDGATLYHKELAPGEGKNPSYKADPVEYLDQMMKALGFNTEQYDVRAVPDAAGDCMMVRVIEKETLQNGRVTKVNLGEFDMQVIPPDDDDDDRDAAARSKDGISEMLATVSSTMEAHEKTAAEQTREATALRAQLAQTKQQLLQHRSTHEQQISRLMTNFVCVLNTKKSRISSLEEELDTLGQANVSDSEHGDEEHDIEFPVVEDEEKDGDEDEDEEEGEEEAERASKQQHGRKIKSRKPAQQNVGRKRRRRRQAGGNDEDDDDDEEDALSNDDSDDQDYRGDKASSVATAAATAAILPSDDASDSSSSEDDLLADLPVRRKAKKARHDTAAASSTHYREERNERRQCKPAVSTRPVSGSSNSSSSSGSGSRSASAGSNGGAGSGTRRGSTNNGRHKKTSSRKKQSSRRAPTSADMQENELGSYLAT